MLQKWSRRQKLKLVLAIVQLQLKKSQFLLKAYSFAAETISMNISIRSQRYKSMVEGKDRTKSKKRMDFLCR